MTMNDSNVTVMNGSSGRQTPEKNDLWKWRVGLFGIGGSTVCVVGIVCNIFAIIVLAQFRNKSSAPFLLICLGVLDTVYLITSMVNENMTILSSARLISREFRDAYTPIYRYTYPIPLMAQTVSSYTVLLISVERYVVVAWPFKAYTLCSRKSAIMAIVVILVFGGLFQVPNCLAYTYDYRWLNGTQIKTSKNFIRTDFGNSELYNEIYFKWVSMVVNFAIPFCGLLVVNLMLLRALRLNRRLAANFQNRAHTEHRLTIMVICMTAIFFLCELIEVVSFILTARKENYTHIKLHINRFSAFADTVVELNSAINFAIYCATGRKFRETFSRLFCRCVKARCLHAVRLNKKTITFGNLPRSSEAFKVTSTRLCKICPTEGSMSSNSTKSSKANSFSADNAIIFKDYMGTTGAQYAFFEPV
ncbi:unnamed protein product [Lymnaea stagnalis]|uniref:G-protein coupled receptors family 1 profile domain-containing protein n=1 Tax=Lymnaea stagnalis TaxID=6523 RepID=A0AAV2H4Z6_LYMST